MRALVLFLALALAGCGSAPKGEPQIQIVEKKVPVAVPCVSDDTPPPPAYPDTDEALKQAGGAAERYGLIAAGRVLRIQRLAETEPLIAACRK